MRENIPFPFNGKHDYSKGSKLLGIFEDLADIMSDMKPSSDDVKMTRAFAKTRMKIKKESRGNHSTITIRKIDFKSGI